MHQCEYLAVHRLALLYCGSRYFSPLAPRAASRRTARATTDWHSAATAGCGESRHQSQAQKPAHRCRQRVAVAPQAVQRFARSHEPLPRRSGRWQQPVPWSIAVRCLDQTWRTQAVRPRPATAPMQSPIPLCLAQTPELRRHRDREVHEATPEPVPTHAINQP